MWFRADSTNGYIHELEIYLRENLGKRVVLDLARKHTGRLHGIYFDIFFGSVNLLIQLQKGVNACGTTRKDRQNVPKVELDKVLKRGKWITSYLRHVRKVDEQKKGSCSFKFSKSYKHSSYNQKGQN